MKGLHLPGCRRMRSRWTMEAKAPRALRPGGWRVQPLNQTYSRSQYIGIELRKAKSFVTPLTVGKRQSKGLGLFP